MYFDKVKYFEHLVQVAYRDGSLEINRLNANVYGYRFNKNGCWFITSSQDNGLTDFNTIKVKALHFLSDRKCEGFADATLFKGYIEIGKEMPQEDEIIGLIKDLCDEAKALRNIKCEVIANMKTINKKIIRENEEFAEEVKRLIEIEIGLLELRDISTNIIATNYKVVIPWSKDYIAKVIDTVFRETINKLNIYSKARPLKPYQYGKANTVFGFETSAAFIHEISHLLEADYQYNPRFIGSAIASKDFNLYDNPHDYDSPAIRFFDDEGVSTKRRTLIEDGVIRDFHHTRNTAAIHGSEPGSAYGLFQKPIPFHTTLVLKSGDWKEMEIISETRNGFYIGGIVMASLEKGYIRIIPEDSFIIENGELSEAIKIRELKVPLTNLKTINAISKSLSVRTSREKEWIVAEKAPYIRLEAFVT
jgi:predicted Zn-dependent protease